MKLCINDFEGPLDLLLHLVKTAKMDIYEIDTKYIIDKYLEFIKSIPSDDLDDASEYLVMASELIHLKSRLLLNLKDESTNDEDEYSINSEEDLKNKLIEYEKYQTITNDFRELEKNRQDYFTKVPESLKEYANNETYLSDDVSLEDLVNAMLEISERLEYKKPRNTKIARKEISVKDKINYIKDILSREKKVEFTRLFNECTKEEIVVTFLSILEMSKDNLITLSQNKNFSKIYVEVYNE